MTDALTILEETISDVGYWRWWDASLPSVFAVEFGGVKLWEPPKAPDLPPPGIVGLGFKNPSLVAFLTADSASDLRKDWRNALHNDEIKPFGFFDNIFTLQSSDLFDRIIEGCSIEYFIGSEAALAGTSTARLGFRAGPVGLIVLAEAMAVQPFSERTQIVNARDEWQRYWSEYWSRKDTESPMPKDYACEVCIPFERYRFHDG